jgi:hypothetical protein
MGLVQRANEPVYSLDGVFLGEVVSPRRIVKHARAAIGYNARASHGASLLEVPSFWMVGRDEVIDLRTVLCREQPLVRTQYWWQAPQFR